MPQLIPFYFLNLLTFVIITLTILLYIVSKKLLPNLIRLILTRTIIVNL